MNVRGVITDGFGKSWIDSFSLDSPRRGEVLVEMKASGVCHTDLDHMWWKERLIVGHEGAGVVAQVGEDVENLKVGDSVVLNWAIPCGHCFQCTRGAQNLCEARPVLPTDRYQYLSGELRPMFGLGTMAEMTLVPYQAVTRIPESMPFAIAAIMGCGVMTGYGSVVNVAKVEPGASVAVIGCGGVGLSVVQAARFRKAEKIIAVDLEPDKLARAKSFGATHTLLTSREDVGLLDAAAQVRSLTLGRGTDYAFECTAIPELGMSPLAMVRRGGMAVGVSGIEQVIPADMELFEFDKWYINPLYGACVPERDFPQMVSLYEQGELDLDALISHRYSLDQAEEAFNGLRKGTNVKGVIEF
jgi:S-(hydroxymethyl)glutathione dehydrogenase / alcohol dehydrogenase